ncbi:hypothetical protein [Crossiella sp. S99.1]|uniref:hypothetical protein n=1 Tax=Crossiella sp. S99.1 TaxID=2936271 RepID=UPI001FFEB45B|nr:hypothetical protein [Crossiella sp. S99.1]MCK2258293.1 hypothetical protein [Crossiella sp. S99.1]
MKAYRITDCEKHECPALYVTDTGVVIAQGDPADDVDGVTLGEGERAVQLPLDVLKKAVATLQGRGIL